MRISLVSRMIDRQPVDFGSRSLTRYQPGGTSPHDMTRTRKILTSSFSILLLLGVVAPAGAKCVFRKSCTRNAFKCFQPKGACTGALADAGASAVCWPNGSKISAGVGGITV